MRCRACGEKHEAWIRCEVAKAKAEVALGRKEHVEVRRDVLRDPAPGLDGARRAGRPRVYADPKARHREYMKSWRAGKKVA